MELPGRKAPQRQESRMVASADASSPQHGDSVQGFQFSAYDLSLGDDSLVDDVSLEGLEEELEHFQGQEVVSSILGQGSELREFARDVEEKLRQVELESIQDYIKESDNLVLLHTQIRECDSILGKMEELLGGFQADLGAISSEIKNLQEQSMSMGIKLRNRKDVEGKLAKFLEDIVLSPELIDNIFEGEMNEAYLKSLETLSRKLIFTYEHPTARTAASLKDVEPELEKLRVKAVAKSREFLLQKLYALRKPKTNVQILQQNVLLRHKYLATFLREHGKEIYPEIRNAYVDTMGKVLCAHFKTYIQALMKVQLDLVSKNDLIAAEDLKTGGLFSRVTSKEVLKNRSAVFSLGDRAAVLKEIDQPAIIPHIAEGSGQRYPYEVLFRSIHKLLMDTATSE
ncbi:hypothetical protein CBR_g54934 [Chara braunii]|uniref:Vacuolar protein sorting-associated protein 52 homolog n=1 Tax=Chara braunii TaxID=69332 RepID=A0A388K7C1_CHABU|nr:hypothetical protein CBR_g54934 [Chara braunii]|eukprot:GBG65955.1 hypothetical protein CBR_g54934 [Chara braunii]